MTERRALVRLDGQPVGTLVESGKQVAFAYDAQWRARRDAVPVSLTIPLRPEPYVTEGLHPYFVRKAPYSSAGDGRAHVIIWRPKEDLRRAFR